MARINEYLVINPSVADEVGTISAVPTHFIPYRQALIF
jgi:hypothetical protein